MLIEDYGNMQKINNDSEEQNIEKIQQKEQETTNQISQESGANIQMSQLSITNHFKKKKNQPTQDIISIQHLDNEPQQQQQQQQLQQQQQEQSTVSLNVQKSTRQSFVDKQKIINSYMQLTSDNPDLDSSDDSKKQHKKILENEQDYQNLRYFQHQLYIKQYEKAQQKFQFSEDFKKEEHSQTNTNNNNNGTANNLAFFDLKLATKQSRRELAHELHLKYLLAYKNKRKYCHVSATKLNKYEAIKNYKDNMPFLKLRQNIMLCKLILSGFCAKIIRHQAFEVVSLVVIIINSITMALEDPTQGSKQSYYLIIFENFFLGFYTLEIITKILGMGFVLKKGSFMREYMNVMDFFIVMAAYVQVLVQSNQDVSLAPFRIIRVLRPLRTLGRISNLRIIISALFGAVSLLEDSFILMIFLYTLFAIAGLHMFSGMLLKRCFFGHNGMMIELLRGKIPFCVDSGFCRDEYWDKNQVFGYENIGHFEHIDVICGKMLDNPNHGHTNFDHFWSSFFQIFQVVTLENWSFIMEGLMKTMSPFVVVYFLIVVIIGAFLLMNLTLAIIKVKYTEANENLKRERKIEQEKEKIQFIQKNQFDSSSSSSSSYSTSSSSDNSQNDSDSQQDEGQLKSSRSQLHLLKPQKPRSWKKFPSEKKFLGFNVKDLDLKKNEVQLKRFKKHRRKKHIKLMSNEIYEQYPLHDQYDNMTTMNQYNMKDLRRYGVWQKRQYYQNKRRQDIKQINEIRFYGKTEFKNRPREFFCMNQYQNLQECAKMAMKHSLFNMRLLDTNRGNKRKTTGNILLSSSNTRNASSNTKRSMSQSENHLTGQIQKISKMIDQYQNEKKEKEKKQEEQKQKQQQQQQTTQISLKTKISSKNFIEGPMSVSPTRQKQFSSNLRLNKLYSNDEKSPQKIVSFQKISVNNDSSDVRGNSPSKKSSSKENSKKQSQQQQHNIAIGIHPATSSSLKSHSIRGSPTLNQQGQYFNFAQEGPLLQRSQTQQQSTNKKSLIQLKKVSEDMSSSNVSVNQIQLKSTPKAHIKGLNSHRKSSSKSPKQKSDSQSNSSFYSSGGKSSSLQRISVQQTNTARSESDVLFIESSRLYQKANSLSPPLKQQQKQKKLQRKKSKSKGETLGEYSKGLNKSNAKSCFTDLAVSYNSNLNKSPNLLSIPSSTQRPMMDSSRKTPLHKAQSQMKEPKKTPNKMMYLSAQVDTSPKVRLKRKSFSKKEKSPLHNTQNGILGLKTESATKNTLIEDPLPSPTKENRFAKPRMSKKINLIGPNNLDNQPNSNYMLQSFTKMYLQTTNQYKLTEKQLDKKVMKVRERTQTQAKQKQNKFQQEQKPKQTIFSKEDLLKSVKSKQFDSKKIGRLQRRRGSCRDFLYENEMSRKQLIMEQMKDKLEALQLSSENDQDQVEEIQKLEKNRLRIRVHYRNFKDQHNSINDVMSHLKKERQVERLKKKDEFFRTTKFDITYQFNNVRLMQPIKQKRVVSAYALDISYLQRFEMKRLQQMERTKNMRKTFAAVESDRIQQININHRRQKQIKAGKIDSEKSKSRQEYSNRRRGNSKKRTFLVNGEKRRNGSVFSSAFQFSQMNSNMTNNAPGGGAGGLGGSGTGVGDIAKQRGIVEKVIVKLKDDRMKNEEGKIDVQSWDYDKIQNIIFEAPLNSDRQNRFFPSSSFQNEDTVILQNQNSSQTQHQNHQIQIQQQQSQQQQQQLQVQQGQQQQQQQQLQNQIFTRQPSIQLSPEKQNNSIIQMLRPSKSNENMDGNMSQNLSSNINDIREMTTNNNLNDPSQQKIIIQKQLQLLEEQQKIISQMQNPQFNTNNNISMMNNPTKSAQFIKSPNMSSPKSSNNIEPVSKYSQSPESKTQVQKHFKSFSSFVGKFAQKFLSQEAAYLQQPQVRAQSHSANNSLNNTNLDQDNATQIPPQKPKPKSVIPTYKQHVSINKQVQDIHNMFAGNSKKTQQQQPQEGKKPAFSWSRLLKKSPTIMIPPKDLDAENSNNIYNNTYNKSVNNSPSHNQNRNLNETNTSNSPTPFNPKSNNIRLQRNNSHSKTVIISSQSSLQNSFSMKNLDNVFSNNPKKEIKNPLQSSSQKPSPFNTNTNNNNQNSNGLNNILSLEQRNSIQYPKNSITTSILDASVNEMKRSQTSQTIVNKNSNYLNIPFDKKQSLQVNSNHNNNISYTGSNFKSGFSSNKSFQQQQPPQQVNGGRTLSPYKGLEVTPFSNMSLQPNQIPSQQSGMSQNKFQLSQQQIQSDRISNIQNMVDRKINSVFRNKGNGDYTNRDSKMNTPEKQTQIHHSNSNNNLQQGKLRRKQNGLAQSEIPKNFDFDFINDYNQIKLNDIENESKQITAIWSGEDVLRIKKDILFQITDERINNLNLILGSMNYARDSYMIWLTGISGCWYQFRKLLRRLNTNYFYNLFNLFCMTSNTLILTTDGLVEGETEETMYRLNNIFIVISAVDKVVKIIGMGYDEFFKDKLNSYDTLIVALSIIELFILESKNSAISAFRSVRLFRILRVLRFTKVFKKVQYMSIIIDTMMDLTVVFFYLLFLSILFIYIYSLLGMEIFGGRLDGLERDTRQHWDSFTQAFNASFQLMSAESWPKLFFDVTQSNISHFAISAYFWTWIIIGKYVLLNLFLAMVIDGFSSKEIKHKIEVIEEEQEEDEIDNYTKSQKGPSNQDPKIRNSIMIPNGNSNNALNVTQQPLLSQQNTLFSQDTNRIYRNSILNTQQTSLIHNYNNKRSNFRILPQSYSPRNSISQVTQQPFIKPNPFLNPLLPINSQTQLEQQQQSSDLNNNIDKKNSDDDNDSQISEKDIQFDSILYTAGYNQKVKFKMYDKIQCYNSFYVFSMSNWVRKMLYRIVKHEWFDNFIIFLIICNSMVLVIDTYRDQIEWEYIEDVLLISNYLFTILFTLEALFKSIAFGFVMEKNSYLRESWNCLDFMIVLISLVDIIFRKQLDLGAITILRLFRALRPLRFITHNLSLRLVVTALLESVSGILTVIVLLFMIWIMFGVLGTNLLKEKTKYCYFQIDSPHRDQYSIYELSEQDCLGLEGGHWVSFFLNFDNIFQALQTLFVLSSFEGWPDYIYRFIDATEDGPVQNSNTWVVIYFFFFLMLGSVFFVKLFIGVIFLNYIIAERKAKNKNLTEAQSKWISIQRLILKSTPNYQYTKLPDNDVQLFFYKITNHRLFIFFIYSCIIGNVIVMALHHEGASKSNLDILEALNQAFTVLFLIEAMMKMMGVGIKQYFYNKWNTFDFMVVVISLVDMIYGSLFNIGVDLTIGKIFRVLRVLRLIRLIRGLQGLQQLILTTIYSLPALLSVVSLISLIFFIYSVLAVFLFSEVKQGEIINDSSNFSNFLEALMLLFKCSTGENWYLVMFDTSKVEPLCVPGIDCGSKFSIPYFITFVIFVQYIMLNLFILILVNELETNYLNVNNPLKNFEILVEQFQSQWVTYAYQYKGIKIKERMMIEFLLYLQYPLGLDYENELEKFQEELKNGDMSLRPENEWQYNQLVDKFQVQMRFEASKELMSMNISIDQDGYLYYNDILYALFKAMLLESVKEEATPKGLDTVFKAEQSTLQKLKTIRDKLSSSSSSSQQKEDQEKKKNQNVRYNPVVRLLFVQMAVKGWIKYSLGKEQQRIQKQQHKAQMQALYAIGELSTSQDEDEKSGVDTSDSQLTSSDFYSSTSSSQSSSQTDSDSSSSNSSSSGSQSGSQSQSQSQSKSSQSSSHSQSQDSVIDNTKFSKNTINSFKKSKNHQGKLMKKDSIISHTPKSKFFAFQKKQSKKYIENQIQNKQNSSSSGGKKKKTSSGYNTDSDSNSYGINNKSVQKSKRLRYFKKQSHNAKNKQSVQLINSSDMELDSSSQEEENGQQQQVQQQQENIEQRSFSSSNQSADSSDFSGPSLGVERTYSKQTNFKPSIQVSSMNKSPNILKKLQRQQSIQLEQFNSPIQQKKSSKDLSPTTRCKIGEIVRQKNQSYHQSQQKKKKRAKKVITSQHHFDSFSESSQSQENIANQSPKKKPKNMMQNWQNQENIMKNNLQYLDTQIQNNEENNNNNKLGYVYHKRGSKFTDIMEEEGRVVGSSEDVIQDSQVYNDSNMELIKSRNYDQIQEYDNEL